MRTQKRLTNVQLTKLCKQWQARLRLQDWDVKVRWAHANEMMSPETAGQCRTLGANKEAQIQICETPTDPVDPEYILVHELGHLHLDPIATPKNERDIEQALHGFVHALMEGKR